MSVSLSVLSLSHSMHSILRAVSVLNNPVCEGALKQHTVQHGRPKITSPYVPTESSHESYMAGVKE